MQQGTSEFNYRDIFCHKKTHTNMSQTEKTVKSMNVPCLLVIRLTIIHLIVYLYLHQKCVVCIIISQFQPYIPMADPVNSDLKQHHRLAMC